METVHFSAFIQAPRESVWNIMLSEEGYRQWTKPFNAGSYFEGSWEEGASIKFLGTNEDGKGGGLISRIAKSKKPEYVSIEHLGVVIDGKEVTDSPDFKEWSGAHENYTFNEKDGGTELLIDLDTTHEEAPQMSAMWEQALLVLKDLCERA